MYSHRMWRMNRTFTRVTLSWDFNYSFSTNFRESLFNGQYRYMDEDDKYLYNKMKDNEDV